MRRDAVVHALGIALLAIWASAALVLAATFSNRAPTWLAVTVALLAIAKTWIVYNHVHLPRKAERLAHERAKAQHESLVKGESTERGRIAAVLDAVPEAVIATDSSGVVRVANAAARELFDVLSTPSRSIEDVFTQGDVLSMHARALAGQPGQMKIRHNHRGSLRVYEVIACPLAESQSPSGARPRFGVVVVVRDVTELALAVQLKTDFVANASHELRTPLSSIRLAMETIAEAGREDPALTSRLSMVVLRNTTRLEDLVRDLLDLSRIESPDVPAAKERVVLTDMIAGIEQLFTEVRVARRLRIEASIAPEATEFDSDPRLIELILKNLIDNATKFAFEGTTISVGAQRLAPREGSSETIRITVADQGVGIPIAQQARIFERFYQVDGARSGPTDRRGTGLGLAIVKHAIKRLGGSIRVESVWQQGTAMIVDITPGLTAAGED
jgi:two-component system, OmpR family, phosphate regulon sensor histidine kinase PhoR